MALPSSSRQLLTSSHLSLSHHHLDLPRSLPRHRLTRLFSLPLSLSRSRPFSLSRSHPLSLSTRTFSSTTHSQGPNGPSQAYVLRTRSTDESTSSTPTDLTDTEKALVDRIIRVDQAGELGANWIYRGQAFGSRLRGDLKTVKDVEEMWETEKHHLDTLSQLRLQHSARPTLLYPLWQGMAFGLGTVTALMGREAAMACTEAVETVIGEHYDDQLRDLKPLLEKNKHPSLHLMSDILEEFRDDELEHLDTAVEEGAQKAPGHSLLSAVVGFGCKGAIKICEKI